MKHGFIKTYPSLNNLNIYFDLSKSYHDMLFNDIPIPQPDLLIVCEIITFTMLMSSNSGQGFMAGCEDYMSLSVSNPSVLCSMGGNQYFKCWMVLGRPQLLQFLFVIRYVSLTSFITYGFSLLRLQCSHLHKIYMSRFLVRLSC
jgi:hypothetical protein